MPHQNANKTEACFKININTYSIDNILVDKGYYRKDMEDPIYSNADPVDEEHKEFYTILEEELQLRCDECYDGFDIDVELECIVEECIIDYDEEEKEHASRLRDLFHVYYEKEEE